MSEKACANINETNSDRLPTGVHLSTNEINYDVQLTQIKITEYCGKLGGNVPSIIFELLQIIF